MKEAAEAANEAKIQRQADDASQEAHKAATRAHERGDGFFLWETDREGFAITPTRFGKEIRGGRELGAIEEAGWCLEHVTAIYSTLGAVAQMMFVFRRRQGPL